LLTIDLLIKTSLGRSIERSCIYHKSFKSTSHLHIKFNTVVLHMQHLCILVSVNHYHDKKSVISNSEVFFVPLPFFHFFLLQFILNCFCYLLYSSSTTTTTVIIIIIIIIIKQDLYSATKSKDTQAIIINSPSLRLLLSALIEI